MKSKTRNRLLTIVLAIAMTAVFMPVAALAEDGGEPVADYDEFVAAIANTEVPIINVAGGFDLEADVTISREVTITCLSNPGYTITTGDYSIIIDEAVVTISGNLTVTGNGPIHVYDGGTADISGGTITAEGLASRGVFVDDGGAADISGGTVTATGEFSTGVYVGDGTVTVSGEPEISGVYVGYGGTADISGGTITAADGGSCVIIEGGGTVDISGGTVTATGEYSIGIIVGGGTATISDGTITVTGEYSTGIYVGGGTVTVSGGTITATGNESKGLYKTGRSGSATVSGGTITATGGASRGIYANNYGLVTISGEPEISGEVYGVYLDLNSTADISGGIITAAGNGGYGVYVTEFGTVDISGGAITGTGADGYGIYVDSYGAVTVSVSDNLTISGGVHYLSIYDGPNVFLTDLPGPVAMTAGETGTVELAGVYSSISYEVSVDTDEELTASITGSIVTLAPPVTTSASTYNLVLCAPSMDITFNLIIPVTVAAPPDTVINLAAIGGVIAPVRDAAPVTAITETDQYTGTVSWTPAVADGKFAADTAYTATITLTAKAGYTLTGVTENFFTVEGATTVSNDAGSCVVIAVFPATASEPESGGDGSAENPYQVADPHQLNNVRNYLNAHFILTDDIDMSAYLAEGGPGWNGGAGWEPIGTNAAPFTGVFNGNGHTISHLFIKRPTQSHCGLFGRTDSPSGSLSEIRDLGLLDVDITSAGVSGGLVGYNIGSITSSYVTGTIKANGSNAGGLAGLHEGAISDCYTSVQITGYIGVGGLVGMTNTGTITNSHAAGSVTGLGDSLGGLVGESRCPISGSYATGNVTGTGAASRVGGLVGWNSSSITVSYATGNVTGTGAISRVGGLVGWNSDSITVSYATGNVQSNGDCVGGLVGFNEYSLTNCYALGSVNGGSGTGVVGGLVGLNFGSGVTIWFTYAAGAVAGAGELGAMVGRNESGAQVSRSYYNMDIFGRCDDPNKGWALATSQMMQASVFRNWSFEEDGGIWTIREGSSYPYLQQLIPNPLPAPPATVTYNGNGGTGTAPTESGKAEGATFIAAANTFTPPSGKQFKEWNTESGGTGRGYAPGTTVTMPAGNLTLYAIWEDIPVHTVRVSANPLAGGIVNGEGSYSEGIAVTVTATPNSGYTFVNWTEGGTQVSASASYTFTMGTTDRTLAANFDAAPIAPSIITDSLPGGTVGTVYSQTLAADGDRPITWTIDSGTLPDGLSLSGETISGTPATAGNFDFTVKAVNAAGSATQTLGIVISAIPPDKTLVSITAPTEVTGVANGTSKTAEALGLPGKVTLVTDEGNVQADVDWDVAGCAYDPEETGEQTFEVAGTVTLPAGVINPADVDLTVTVSVTVNEALAVTHTVTFHKNGGDTEASPASRTVASGGNIGTLPEPPTRTGYTFSGWNTAADGSGTAFTATTAITSNITVYARWTLSSLSMAMNPDHAKAGESISIVGSTSPTVPVSILVLKGDGRVVYNLDTTSGADGSFAGTFTVPADMPPGLLYGSATAVGKKATANAVVYEETKPYVSPVEITTPSVMVSSDGSNKNLELPATVSSSSPPITVSVPAGVTDSTIAVTQLLNAPSGGAVETQPLPALSIEAVTAVSANPVKVDITSGTAVTAPAASNWDGTINIPTVKAKSSVTVSADSGKTAAVSTVIEVGCGDVPLTFTKAVRLLIPGMAGQEAGYTRGGTFTKITRMLSADSQSIADAEIPAGGDARIDVGSDMVIWTKHFTSFIAYTQTTIPDDSGDYGGSSGGGSSGSSSGSSVITAMAQTTADKALDKALAATGKATLTLSDSNNIARLSAAVIQGLEENNKPFTVINTGLQLYFVPGSLNVPGISGQALVEIGAREVTGAEKEAIISGSPTGESTGLYEIGGKIFDLTAMVKSGSNNQRAEKIEEFGKPVAVTLNLSHLGDLTPEQLSKLTSVRLEKDEQGNIVPVSLGGIYDPATKTVTFYTDQFSLYTVMRNERKLLIRLVIGDTAASVNGKAALLDTPPVLINDRTMVPVRFVAEGMGAQVDWNGETQTVKITLDGKELSLGLGQVKPEAGLDVSAQISNNRTLVPLRYVSETLSAKVNWQAETKTVEIVK